MLACLAGFKKKKMGSAGSSLSLVAIVDAVQVFALQFTTGRGDTWDFMAEAVHAPANTPFPSTRGLTLQGRRRSDQDG